MVAPATTAAETHVYESINPANGEVLAIRPSLDARDAEPLLARAHETFLTWRNVPVAEKVRLFTAAADVIDAHADELGRETALEMGKIHSHGVAEAKIGADMFRYYAKHGEELLADEVVQVPGFSKSYVRREPIGVVLGIEPWNAPIYQALRAAVPNLMVGNTVLVKPARITAGTTLLLDDLFIEAGFPVGAYQTALLSTDAALELIADRRIRAVTLTGSDRAGLHSRRTGKKAHQAGRAGARRVRRLRRARFGRRRQSCCDCRQLQIDYQRPSVCTSQARDCHRRRRRCVHREVLRDLRQSDSR